MSAFEETEEEEQLYVDEEGSWNDSWKDWTVGALSDDWSWFGDSWDSIPGKTLAGIGGPLLTLVEVNGLRRPGRPHRKLCQQPRKRPLKTLLCLKRPQFRL